MKICNACREEKALSEYHNLQASKDGKQPRCKSCVRAYWRMHHARTYYEKTYGISREDYNAMLAAQGGVCAVCGGDNNGKALCVDHNHTTGEVRELLCTGCNSALGSLKEDPERIAALMAYAIKHGKEAN